MFNSQKLQNLRLGPVAQAARVKEGTAAAWRTRRTVNLTLGVEPRPGANRRYDLRDAAALLLMRVLTEQLGMSASAAAFATKFARAKFTFLAACEYTKIDHPSVPVPAREYLMIFDRVDGTFPPEIIEISDDQPAPRQWRWVQISVNLNQILEEATNNLMSETGGDFLAYRESLRQ